MTEQIPTTFRTDDIHIASFIKVKGGKLLNIGFQSLDDDNYKRYYFEFEDVELCNKLKFDYMNGSVGSAKELFDTREMFVKQVKNLGKGFQ